MDFFDVVKERHSVRAYKKKEVKEEKLQKILEAANAAPSAGNLQSYEIVVVKDKKIREKTAAATFGQDFIAEAPVLLVICANTKRAAKYGRRGRELYCINDASIAAAYIQMAAAALGLATVWVGAFDEADVGRIVNAPMNMRPIAIIPVGYPDEKPGPTSRRSLGDLVHNETF